MEAKPQIKPQGIQKPNFGLNYIVLNVFNSMLMILISLGDTNFGIGA